jgi:hypothetical protein
MEQREEDRLSGLRVLGLLSERRLQIRVNIHGTLGLRSYLFDSVTGDGLKPNGLVSGENLLLPRELIDMEGSLSNIGSEGYREATACFDRLWRDGEDVTALLADEIRASWVGALAQGNRTSAPRFRENC